MTRPTAVIAVVVAAGAVVAWFARPSVDPRSEDDAAARATATAPAAPAALSARAGKKDGDGVAASGARRLEDESGSGNAAGSSSQPLRVLVVADGKPVEGAKVRVWTPSAAERFAGVETGPDGVALLDAAAVAKSSDSNASIDAWATGYRSATTRTRWMDRYGDGSVRLELERGVPFAGRVVDLDSGLAVPGAVVSVRDGNEDVEVGPLDEEGRFDVLGVRDDNDCRVAVRAPGYATEGIPVRVDGGKVHPTPLVVRLARAAAIVGTVRAADGTPVEGAIVRRSYVEEDAGEQDTDDGEESYLSSIQHFEYQDTITRPDGRGDVVRTSADGSYRLDGLAADTYRLVAEALMYGDSPPSAAVVLERGGETRVDLTLQRAATVLLAVVVPNGAALPDRSRVRLFRIGFPVRPSGIDADGRFRFSDLAPGTYHAFVQAPGLRSVSKCFAVAEGATADVSLSLEAGATVEGVVVDERGGPLHGATVEVAPVSRNEPVGKYLHGEREEETDARGRFSIGGVAAGDVYLAVRLRRGGRWLGTRVPLRLTAPATGLWVAIGPRGSIRARLVMPEGNPFRGKLDGWVLHEGGGSGVGEVDEGGRFEEDGLIDGEYRLILRPAGYAWLERTVAIRDGAVVDLGELMLDRGHAVEGRVVDRQGRPLVGAAVSTDVYVDRSTRTDADGRFRLDRTPKRAVSLEVSLDGYVGKTIEVDPVKPTGHDVVLARPAAVRAKITRAEGKPVPPDSSVEMRPKGAAVERTTSPQPDGAVVEETRSDESGWIGASDTEPTELAPGDYVGWWNDEAGKEHRVGEWTFAEGETKAIEIVLPAK